MLVKHDYLEIKLLKAGKKILKNEKENNKTGTVGLGEGYSIQQGDQGRLHREDDI